MLKLVGKKIGMSHLYDEYGVFIPVTIVYIPKHYLLEVKDFAKYKKFVVCAIEKKENRTIKPILGLFKKKNIPVCKIIFELKFCDQYFLTKEYLDINDLKIGYINVTGFSKGKGFAGVVKRWGFHMQDATHGNSLSHRAPGSIGQHQSPGRVIKGKKMAGHLGNKKITKKNLYLCKINIENNLIYIKGSIPGSKNNNVFISFK